MEIKLVLQNKEGLHARPAGIFAKESSKFKSNILVRFNGQSKSAKSIMALMSLGIKSGQEFTLTADGEDASEACLYLEKLVKNEFKL